MPSRSSSSHTEFKVLMEKYQGLKQRAVRKKPSPQQMFQLVHDLSNSLAALQLRLQILESDPTCKAAQGDNLSRVIEIAAGRGASARRLEEWAALDRSEDERANRQQSSAIRQQSALKTRKPGWN